jgi:4-amino-4-deoxychorismate lyase
MSLLIESIRLENGRFHRLQYHQARINHAFAELYPSETPIDLSGSLVKSQYPKSGLFKCRVLYNSGIQSLEFIPYVPKDPKTLIFLHSNEIEYHHKFEDRSKINTLFEERQFCDDILIVKNGYVTDSSCSNIIFFDGYQWVTSNTPLLKGTMRQMLLDAAEIKPRPIAVQDIPSFKSFRLINAMLGFDGPEIEVSGIVF